MVRDCETVSQLLFIESFFHTQANILWNLFCVCVWPKNSWVMDACVWVHMSQMCRSDASGETVLSCVHLHLQTLSEIHTADIINLTSHCAAVFCAAIPNQMLGFYGFGQASKALYYFKSVVKYFQEAHIKEISFCDRLCWLCRRTKHKKRRRLFLCLPFSNKTYWAACQGRAGYSAQ